MHVISNTEVGYYGDSLYWKRLCGNWAIAKLCQMTWTHCTMHGVDMTFKRQPYHLFDQVACYIQYFIHWQSRLIAPILLG